ncbi:MAG TPA: hypothetical protein VLS52_08935 [Rudaea sp.]|nr:hypothetical protein [Rudaea sp.]
MDIETLALYLLLAASFAAGLSGLLVLAHNHDDIGRRGDLSARNRRIARVLFVLSASMLVWAAVWVLGTHASNLFGNVHGSLHNFLVVGVAAIAGIANYLHKRRERARKRDVR